MTITKPITWLFFLIVLTGCSNTQVAQFVKAPEIQSVRLSHFSAKDNQAVFILDLYNPNPFPLPISAIAADIELNQLLIGSLSAESDRTLGALATQTVTVPLRLDQQSLVNAAQSVLLRGEANYRLNGDVKSSVGRVPFNKQGQLSIDDVLTALVPKFF